MTERADLKILSGISGLDQVFSIVNQISDFNQVLSRKKGPGL
jgi:hypothetical protein